MTGAHSGPLVSVLTPVFNGESYIAECIESVLRQTYSNWEYVIVNNRSTDRTLDIAQHYARRDPRIRVHPNERFVGAIANHNIAVSLMSPDSKYCKILNADDWLFPECLTRMVEVAEAYPNVGIVSSYRLEDRFVRCDGLPYPSTCLPGREVGRLSLLDDVHVFGSMSTFLIRADLVCSRTPFFNVAHVYADTEACFRVLQYCDFGFVHQVLSFSRVHQKQVTCFANEYQLSTLAKLTYLQSFGAFYLSPPEQRTELARALDQFYRTQGKALLELRGSEFLRYHRRLFTELGFSYSWYRVVKGCCLEVLRIATVPFRIVARRLRALLTSGRQMPDPSRHAVIEGHGTSC